MVMGITANSPLVLFSIPSFFVSTVLHSMSFITQLPQQCCGITRAGRRCSISAKSPFRDRNTGEDVTLPLRCGGKYCVFHMKKIVIKEPRHLTDDATRIIFFDLETTGLATLTANIVEISAVDACSGAVFSSTVKPTTESNDQAQRINGISLEELENSPTFPIVFERFCRFLNAFEIEETSPHQMSLHASYIFHARGHDRSKSVLVGHNAKHYDAVILATECWRHRISLDRLENWDFADSLDLVNAIRASTEGPSLECSKLQCLQSALSMDFNTRVAHRALDDTFMLLDCVAFFSVRYGTSLTKLLSPFRFQVDADATAAEMLGQGVAQQDPCANYNFDACSSDGNIESQHQNTGITPSNKDLCAQAKLELWDLQASPITPDDEMPLFLPCTTTGNISPVTPDG